MVKQFVDSVCSPSLFIQVLTHNYIAGLESEAETGLAKMLTVISPG